MAIQKITKADIKLAEAGLAQAKAAIEAGKSIDTATVVGPMLLRVRVKCGWFGRTATTIEVEEIEPR